MKSTIKRHIVPIVILALISFSCKKSFLDTPDNSRILRQEYVTDLKSTEDFLNGIYIVLSQDFYHGYNIIYPDLIGDNIKPVTGTGPLMVHYSWAQQADETRGSSQSSKVNNMNALWTSGYKIVRACNFVLEKVDQYKDEDNKKADLIKGQALGLRALVNFVMVNVFAQSYNFSNDASHPGIPIVTSSDWTSPVTERETVGTVYANIVGDLNNAVILLPSLNPNKALMNRNAAKGLLARAYLFEEQYEAAKNLAKEVISIVPMMTTNYPSKLFTLQETEALFQLAPEEVNYYTSYAGMYYRTSIQFQATKDIAVILTERSGDLRKSWVTSSTGNWNITKFPTGVVSGISNPAASYYQTLLRSSEMYLIASESYAKIGIEDSARFFVDQIRKRADVSMPPITATGSALIDSIYKERRKELAFEGFRMFDLLRWKQGVNRVDASNTNAQNLSYPGLKAIAPIPVLDVSLTGLPQNSSY